MRNGAPKSALAAGLTLALTLAAAGCASTGAVPQPFPRPGGTAAGPALNPPAPASVATSARADGYSIAGTALGLRGTPYRNGGSDPSGFDCSGFIWYVFGQYGIGVPRTVGDQFREGVEVRSDAVEPGDLLFFSTAGAGRFARRDGDRRR